MEELQSTEILDREILEDARKKALRILKTADDTIHAQTAEWEKKARDSIDGLEAKYSEQKKSEFEKVMARLPIDKLRAKVERIEKLLQSSVEAWYKNLSRIQILGLLKSELSKRLSLCGEFSTAAKKRVLIHGIDKKETQEILKTFEGTWSIEEALSTSHYPSITLETGDVRVIVSIQKIVDFLLQEKREELVEALVGREFMDGQL